MVNNPKVDFHVKFVRKSKEPGKDFFQEGEEEEEDGLNKGKVPPNE